MGWQAPHTLGRRIVEKQAKIRIFGEEYDLNAQVATINGCRAPMQTGLSCWNGQGIWANGKSHTFIVHGEEDASLALAEALQHEQQFENVAVPQLGQKFKV
ncbi:MAG: hypothetical protein R3D55_08675 [Chloroflexota bacterium]